MSFKDFSFFILYYVLIGKNLVQKKKKKKIKLNNCQCHKQNSEKYG